jgi:hypothetical protein
VTEPSSSYVAPGTLSPDRSWVWTGGGWVHVSQAQYSADRTYIWNGTQWLPNGGWAAPPTPNATAPIPNAATPNTASGAPRTTPQGHTARNIAIAVGAVIVVAAIISNAAKAPSPTTSTNTSAVVSVAATPKPTPIATSTPSARASTPPAALKVLLDKTASGTSKTAYFTTPSEWEIDYYFDCTGFGYQGNFQIYVYDGTSALKDLPVNTLALKGSDFVFEHNLSGPYYLEINSECDWHVIVKG